MDSVLYFEKMTLPAANLGPDNPLPVLSVNRDIHAQVKCDESISEEDRRRLAYGKLPNVMPYLTQDLYDRKKQTRAIDTAVLENSYVKAVFTPCWGGRLWSLYDKTAGRELLERNPVFQPANLALRNAWISGGVEWNIGTTGHTPFTVSPLFTAAYKMSDGAPVLRLYEWERMRRIAWSLDAYLPNDSKFLFIRIKLCNTRGEEVPVYWWSNIAVPEKEGTRVVAPAETAYCFDYTQVLAKRKVPVQDGVDRSYTTRVPRAMDLFFAIEPERRKWEAALDKTGYGLAQTSTDRLMGRKLFMWGVSAGGGHWQEYLSAPGHAYMEIQAGLAHTQMQHIPMPAGASWQWLEAYGPLQAAPELVHGEWTAAGAEIEAQLEKLLPRDKVDAELARVSDELDMRVEPIDARGGGAQADFCEKPDSIASGAGWAALERRRLEKIGKSFDVDGLVFDDGSIGETELDWLKLLEEGVFEDADPKTPPSSYMVQDEWVNILSESINSGKSENWRAYMHLGVMRCYQGDMEAGAAAFIKSLQLKPSAWSYRNLAVMRGIQGDAEGAVANMTKAIGLAVGNLPLAREYGKMACKYGRYDEFIKTAEAWPEDIRNNGRVCAILLEAAVKSDNFELADRLLDARFEVDDVREGELLLSDLWIQLHKRKLMASEGVNDDDGLTERVKRDYPIPLWLDFRMHI